MYPTSMRINDEGRLVVNFKTEARFRGQFVMSHPGNPKYTETDADEHRHTLTPVDKFCAVKLCPKEKIYKLQYNGPPSDSKRPTALYWWWHYIKQTFVFHSYISHNG